MNKLFLFDALVMIIDMSVNLFLKVFGVYQLFILKDYYLGALLFGVSGIYSIALYMRLLHSKISYTGRI